MCTLKASSPSWWTRCPDDSMCPPLAPVQRRQTSHCEHKYDSAHWCKDHKPPLDGAPWPGKNQQETVPSGHLTWHWRAWQHCGVGQWVMWGWTEPADGSQALPSGWRTAGAPRRTRARPSRDWCFRNVLTPETRRTNPDSWHNRIHTQNKMLTQLPGSTRIKHYISFFSFLGLNG